MLELKQGGIDRSIFRAYDIRGIVDQQLTTKTLFWIGQAIGSAALAKDERRIALGYDGRHSSPSLAQSLRNGILSTGCDVIDIGMVPTPILYYATFVLNTRSGVMITGSHNPANYNGCKIMIDGKTLTDEDIQKLYHRIIKEDFEKGQGELHELDMVERYLDRIHQMIKLRRPLKVVVDAGNGIPGLFAPKLYRRLGCEVQELFCEVDGNFPNHHPDPSQEANLQDLIRVVREQKADIGLAFDGDGDRLGVVTAAGKIILADRQLILFARAMLSEHPGAKVIYDVKCTAHLDPLIREYGGEPLMWKTGHSYIKEKMIETKALLAGEMSGHIFFKDRWYGFDDGLYAGARLLEILAARDEDSDALFAAIPDSINTPELKVFLPEEEKFSLMDKLVAQLKIKAGTSKQAYELVTIDGLRLNFAQGWGLVRSSNTTPCLVLRFEAADETVLAEIQALFRDLLLSVKPDLVLPF